MPIASCKLSSYNHIPRQTLTKTLLPFSEYHDAYSPSLFSAYRVVRSRRLMGPRERTFSPTHQERCRGKKSTIFTCSAPCTCSPCYQRQCLTPPPRGHAVLLSRGCAKQGGCLDTRGSRQLPYQRRRALPVAKLVRVGIEPGAQCLAQSPADRASSAFERDRLYPRPCSPPAVTALTTWHGGNPCEQLVSGRPRSLPPTRESTARGVAD